MTKETRKKMLDRAYTAHNKITELYELVSYNLPNSQSAKELKDIRNKTADAVDELRHELGFVKKEEKESILYNVIFESDKGEFSRRIESPTITGAEIQARRMAVDNNWVFLYVDVLPL